jgi:D-erythronate 2-dehydrogenase
VVGQKAVDLIISRPDPLVERIVSGWPRAFDPKRAIALGFCADVDFDAIIQTYLDEDFRP